MTSKWKVDYQFRVSRGDRESIAYDLDIAIDKLTENDIKDWMTMLICEELAGIRHERMNE